MLSYQHGFHAGNRADVLKHAILHAVLPEIVKANPKLLYVETHSGRGRYDLEGPQARKGGEANDGILELLANAPPRPLVPWVDHVRERGHRDYPGSPALVQALLPDTARMVFFEKHPTEHAELVKAIGDDPRCQVKHADGYAGALKLAPRSGEQMVCFVDPSYETSRDIDALALWTPKALARWPKGIVILWLPLFRDGREAEFGEYLTTLGDCVVAGARWPVDPLEETALEGTAIVAYRIPKAARETSLSIAGALQSWWGD
ncbi:MAG: 23S rRNA (adenine(2030)-N(6))-methyltransferase RlmJ [Hyphomonas sp.]|nr:23S rRNA (adenine(2030)-N(6))-methyltransferase RlmJ [Hyphomonas sp.]